VCGFTAHAAATQLLDDAVVRDGLADHEAAAMVGVLLGEVKAGKGPCVSAWAVDVPKTENVGTLPLLA
jgi:hypothetical protein